jgi:hypothetical protein
MHAMWKMAIVCITGVDSFKTKACHRFGNIDSKQNRQRQKKEKWAEYLRVVCSTERRIKHFSNNLMWMSAFHYEMEWNCLVVGCKLSRSFYRHESDGEKLSSL